MRGWGYKIEKKGKNRLIRWIEVYNYGAESDW